MMTLMMKKGIKDMVDLANPPREVNDHAWHSPGTSKGVARVVHQSTTTTAKIGIHKVSATNSTLYWWRVNLSKVSFCKQYLGILKNPVMVASFSIRLESFKRIM